MKTHRLLFALFALFATARMSYGLATEEIGPDSQRQHPTTAQPDWPVGIVELARHDSRVYSFWVNGNENFYFKAAPDQIRELVQLFSETRMRDHELRIRIGNPQAKTFDGDQIGYNVDLHVLGGIALAVNRQRGHLNTYEPTLTIYVDPVADQDLFQDARLPDNIILDNEVSTWALTSKKTKPNRKAWHARVEFDDATPATDYEHGISTTVTLWDVDKKAGINLGKVSVEGEFHAVFSDKELAYLEAERSWLTLTTGNWATKPKRDDPRLTVANLALDKSEAQPVRIRKPGFYHGRLLFEDGSPPVLDPIPWPGAEISINFPYAGSANPDAQGYFKVFFTQDQFESLQSKKARKNIYIPSYQKKGRSSALFTFPVSELSLTKDDVFVVKIPNPAPMPDGAE